MIVLQSVIGVLMYGVALDIRLRDLLEALQNPKKIGVALFLQTFVFWALTWVLIQVMGMRASLALGLTMAAACPSGNLGNVLTHVAGGNSAFSIVVVSFSTLLSLVLTPLVLMVGAEAGVDLSFVQLASGIALTIGVPVALGLLTQHYFAVFAVRARPILKKVSLLFLLIFISGAFFANRGLFVTYWQEIVGIVILHVGLFFVTSFAVGRMLRFEKGDLKAFVFSASVKNTALGLGLTLQFFEGLGGMSLVIALWGIVQILMGFVWAKRLEK